MVKVWQFAHYLSLSSVYSVFGTFTMETLIATAFGQYVDVQRGEADLLTKSATKIFHVNSEEAAITPEALFTALCKTVSYCAHTCSSILYTYIT